MTPNDTEGHPMDRKMADPSHDASDGTRKVPRDWAGKWVLFRAEARIPGRVTDTWAVTTKDGFRLGLVEWLKSWRRYVFAPEGDPVFDPECLREIADFCEDQTRARKRLRSRRTTRKRPDVSARWEDVPGEYRDAVAEIEYARQAVEHVSPGMGDRYERKALGEAREALAALLVPLVRDAALGRQVREGQAEAAAREDRCYAPFRDRDTPRAPEST